MFVKKIALLFMCVSFVDLYAVREKTTPVRRDFVLKGKRRFLGRPVFDSKRESFAEYVNRCKLDALQDTFIPIGKSSKPQILGSRVISPVSVIFSPGEALKQKFFGGKFFEREALTVGDNLSKSRTLHQDLNRLQRQTFIEDGHDPEALKKRCETLETEYRLFIARVIDPEESSFLSNLKGLQKQLACEK